MVGYAGRRSRSAFEDTPYRVSPQTPESTALRHVHDAVDAVPGLFDDGGALFS
jgi:hypothetical protein